jgi:hypothetical protein
MARSETLNRWLIWSVIVVGVIAVRLGYVLYQRSRPFTVKQPVQKPLEKDYLVAIPRFYVNDLEDAQKLVGQAVWVKAGYQAEYSTIPDSEKTPAGASRQLFEPMEKITVQKIIQRPSARGNKDKEVLLVFNKENNLCAAVVGFFDSRDNRYQMQLDDLFYIKDPHEIYAHWNPDVWRKVEGHQLEKGMTFTQVALSIGSGSLVTTEAGGIQLYQFNRKPGAEVGRTRVRFADGRVKEFEVLN